MNDKIQIDLGNGKFRTLEDINHGLKLLDESKK